MNAPARTLDRLERLSSDTFAPLADDHADALTGGTAEATPLTAGLTARLPLGLDGYVDWEN